MKKKIGLLIMCIVVLIPTLAYGFVKLSTGDGSEAPEGMQPMVEKILGLVQFAGYGIAMGLLIYLGIKYVMTSADGKADVKKDSVNYLIGVIIIVGCTTLFSAIIAFAEASDKSHSGTVTGGGGGGGTTPSNISGVS